MRIDASNLLLAAQVQTQRNLTPDKVAQPRFEPLNFAKSSAPQESARTTPTPTGSISRPGAQLDIKV